MSFVLAQQGGTLGPTACFLRIVLELVLEQAPPQMNTEGRHDVSIAFTEAWEEGAWALVSSESPVEGRSPALGGVRKHCEWWQRWRQLCVSTTTHQHHSEWPGGGSNVSVHRWMSG